MKTTEAIEVVGSGAELARKLSVTRQAVSNWKANGDLLPELYARRLNGFRKGRKTLKFDPKPYGLDS